MKKITKFFWDNYPKIHYGIVVFIVAALVTLYIVFMCKIYGG